MPPHIPRKRLRSLSPRPTPIPSKKRAVSTTSPKIKPSLFDTYDAEPKSASAAETKAFLDALGGDAESSSELSEADSEEFEDVDVDVPPRRGAAVEAVDGDEEDDSDSDSGSEELEFEDVERAAEEEVELRRPEIQGDFNVAVQAPGDNASRRLELKPGQRPVATKKIREARIAAHCMHVQFLLWHNVVRNSWVNDGKVQDVLVSGLSEGLKAEVKRWKVAMGYESTSRKKNKSNARIRDWGAGAERLEEGGVNLSQGDPIIRLLKYLTAYWKKRFRVTAPGLRKLGYRDPRAMREEMDAWNNGPPDPGRHGEIVRDLEEFRELARKGVGSRDVGAQLFTALLRGLGVEARLVASLQPTGYGWTKGEEATPRTKTGKVDGKIESGTTNGVSKKKSTMKGKTKALSINLDSEGSDLSSPPSSEMEELPSTPAIKSSSKHHDKDLLFPIYWTEVLSPVSNTYIPVSTSVNPTVLTTPDQYMACEPRGAAAEKAKQVICYVIAFSSDGTAKDVTVRYLKKRAWPGKTKGFRIPIEKVPVHNRHGKVLRYDEYDWFKHVMRGYARTGNNTTLADRIEDEGDLVALAPIEKQNKDRNAVPETLQGYKQSATYVLARHLRREEALLPTAEIVTHFSTSSSKRGGTDKEKTAQEAVYRRADVVPCKTSESWHKEGRQVKLGETPLKQVPVRAVTLQRKRDIEDSTRETGTKPTQGLFSKQQTEWIVPEPIGEDGVVPRNVFGNIDVYVPTMVPRGAVHVRLKGSARVCKRLGISYAEACTGFEFGKQRAVPVLTGVVVCAGDEALVREAWREEEMVRREKEEKKRGEVMRALWKRFFRGLKVRRRLVLEYGIDDEGADEDGGGEWARKGGGRFGMEREEDGAGGGFIRDGVEGDGAGGAGAFFLESEDEGAAEFEIVGGSLGKKREVEDRDHDGLHQQLATPISLQARHADTPGEEMGEDDSQPRVGQTTGRSKIRRKKAITSNGKAKAPPASNPRAPRTSPKVEVSDGEMHDQDEEDHDTQQDESDAFVPGRENTKKKTKKRTDLKPTKQGARRSTRKVGLASSPYF